ncbi:autotransporter domain-containing protein [Mesorhizobium retamae]|uniref:Autotransporter domain-containing protein n=1 Tax=Mesorhizobium retamae TaxID=2912854 RepID=A0ABS9QNN0_9HYPH|nr:autotransporter domain-containing protein [Mesorhizobium sp. IRAMC:0171]MCG7509059.1 autotransporter domain-containing protein [Mesorhizobium sp. IRAMC:0171]
MSKDMLAWLAGRKTSTFRMALLRSAAPLTLLLAADPAWAACTPASPTDDAVVSCTGVPILLPPNPNSFLSNANGLNVTVQSGAIMSTLPGGTAMTLGGNGLTLNNLGAIDANAAGSLVLARALAVGNLVTPGSGLVNIDNQGSIEGTLDGTFGLGGAAVVVANQGTTVISNSGTIGLVPLGAFEPDDGIAVGIYGGGNVNFVNTGTITGRVAFASPNSGGNSFVNAGTINGSVSLGTTLSNDAFVAVTGSSLGATGVALPGVTIPTPQVPVSFLTFAATGTVDAGIGGNDSLVLQNTVSGPGSGSGGSGTVSASQYLNFENLTLNSGTWTLQGAVVSGGATLNGGTAIFDNALSFGTTPLTGNGGAIQASVGGLTLSQNVNLAGGLIVQGANSLTLAGTVSGSGGMIKNGAGTLTLASSNNFSGGFALNGGGLTLVTASSLGTGLFLVGGPASLNTAFTGTMTNQVQLNGALTLNGAGALTLGGNINGAGSLTLVSGDLLLAGANNYTGGTVLQAGSVHAGNNSALGVGTLTVNGPAGLTAASGVALGNTVVLNNTLTFGPGGGPLILAGVIGGAGGMSLAGAPGLVLNGANTFIGGFNFGGGALTVGHNTALGTGAVTVSGAGSLDANTAVSLANNFNLNAGLGIASSNDMALNGTIGGLGGITKSRAANLTLGGANSFAGGVNLLAGSLTVGANTSLGLGALTVNGPATFNASADVNLGNAVVLNTDLAINGPNDIVLGGLVSGSAGLSFSGTGMLTLAGDNTFGGGVQLHSGTLRIGGSIGLGTLAVTGNATLQSLRPIGTVTPVTLANGATLTLSGANSIGLNSPISGDGGLLVDGIGVTLGGANNFNGGVELRAGDLMVYTNSSLGTGTLSVTGNASLATITTGLVLNNTIDLASGATLTAADFADLILSGTIGGTGSLAMDGTRKLVLTGDNTFAGATTINAGTVQLGDGGGTGSVAGDIVNNSALIVDRSGEATLAGVISGTGTVTKTGTGTLILSGSNTTGSQYSGTTTVSQGILRVEGTFGDTAGNAAVVNVAGGGTLQGSGTIAGDVAVQSGGMLSAGASPGMLTIAGDLTLDAGSISVFEFGTPNVAGGPTNDLVTVGGNLTMDGTLNVSAASAGYYRLFDVGGTIAGAFDALVTPGFTDANVFVIPNQVNLSVRNASQLLQHWDGSDASGATPGAGGGDGIWDGANTNWTADPIAGAINDAWRGSVAVFGGAAGTVTVAPGTPSFDTLQFNTDGYHLLSGNLAIGVAGANAGNAALTGSIINVTTGTTTINSVIQDGAGNHLNVVGSGTLVLTGANTYTGGTSLLGGRVSVDTDANLGAASGGLTFDGGFLQVRGTAFTGTGRAITWGATGGGFDISSAFNTFTVSQSLGGTGGLSKLGAGTLVLSGANSYTGGTTISQGMLSVGATGALGSGAVAVGTGSALLFQNGTSAGNLKLTTASSTGPGVNGGFIQFADGSSADHAQIVNGSLGAVSFRGTATADAAQFDNSGAVSFWENASAGSAIILNRNGASTNFTDGASAGQATISNMAGSVADFFDTSTAANAVISNDGTVLFRDTTSAGSARIVNGNGGRVLFRAEADASAAQITNTAGGSVDISRATTGTAIGALSGAGNVLLGSKTLTLGGLGGDQTISGIVQDGGAGGGTGGSLIKTGAGTLALTGTNTYTGTTTINAGTLQVSADANLGTGGLIFNGGTLRTTADMTSGRAVTFTGNGTLLTDAGTTLTLSGGLTGSSGLTKTGAGTLALTGDSSAFTGTTSVGQGVLSVNGRLGGTVEVLAGGRLQGTGTVGAVTVAGAIAPGNSIGTLTVNGNYTQLTGSTYEAEIAPDGSSDRIDVTGAASIQGGTVFAAKATGSYTPGSRYTLLTAAGGVTGTYAALDQNAPFIDLALGYDPKAVYLDVIRNAVAFPTIGETPNQKAVAAAAESLGEGNALYNAIAGVPDVSSALVAFDGLSGEVNASTVTGLLEDSRFVREAMNDWLRSAFETVGAVPLMGYGDDARELSTAAVPSERYGAWGSVFGSWGRFDSDGNAAKLSRSVGGFVTGIDGLVTDDIRLGFLAGYSHSSLKVDDRRSSASTDNYHLGIYGGTEWGALAFRSGLAYTWSEIDSGRQVSFPGFTDSLTGDYRAGTTQVFGELGYGIKVGSVALEPFANLAYVNVHTNGFTEQGGASALTVESGSNDVTFTTLGIRASTDFDLGTIKATARGMIGWRHGFGDITPTVSQAFTGSSLFQIAGAPIAKDAAMLEAGLDFAIAPRATLGVSYQGQLGSGASDHGVRADFSVKF